ncbi:MAG TPA: hypothetical protein VGF94_10245 [Kofleriaceae bacterium]
MKTSILLSILVSLAACSSDSSPKPDAAASATLTVKNYLSWCSISVNGGTASTNATMTAPITAPGSITLAATAGTGFELGPTPWHDTAGDTGTGDPGTVSNGTSTATVAVQAANKCVWACCPFPDGTGCPTADQCP